MPTFETTVAWKCPHCGTTNASAYDVSMPSDRTLEYCDSEIGGCDEMVAVFMHRRFDVEVAIVGSSQSGQVEPVKDGA
jgi:hypothetical protein